MILVTHEGQIVGLVTVKDVLRHEAALHHRASTSAPVTPRSSTPRAQMTHRQRNAEGFESTDGWAERWQDFEREDRGNGLEIALEEVLAWVWEKGCQHETWL